MCLDAVSKTFHKNDRMVVGYKVYKRYGKKYRDYFRDNIRKEGEYYTADGPSMLSTISYDDFNYDNYDCGFHVFTSLRSAKQFFKSCIHHKPVICEVITWDIRVKGYDSNRHCIVAKNIRIMGEIEI